MAKAGRHKSRKEALSGQRSRKGLLAIIVIAILAGIPFGLGKYIEFNSPGAFDSGGYVYSAKAVVDGAKIGVDTRPRSTTAPGSWQSR